MTGSRFLSLEHKVMIGPGSDGSAGPPCNERAPGEVVGDHSSSHGHLLAGQDELGDPHQAHGVVPGQVAQGPRQPELGQTRLLVLDWVTCGHRTQVRWDPVQVYSAVTVVSISRRSRRSLKPTSGSQKEQDQDPVDPEEQEGEEGDEGLQGEEGKVDEDLPRYVEQSDGQSHPLPHEKHEQQQDHLEPQALGEEQEPNPF